MAFRQLVSIHFHAGLGGPTLSGFCRSDNNGDFFLKDYCKNDDSELRVLEWPSGSLAALTCRARRIHYLGIPAGAAIMVTSY